MYFKKDKLHDGILLVKEPWRDYFIKSEPLNDLTDQNSWRKGALQWFFVLADIALGFYSYRTIGTKVETEEAVQEGMKVLKDVNIFQWLAFAAYNLIVVIYYHRLLINNIKSGWHAIISIIFCSWCRRSEDLTLETTFKPTWQKDGSLL